jgi:hypothetical protein
MSLTEEKRKLVENKETNGIQGTIEKTDIVGLVTHAWTKSFNRVQTNRKAIAECGWGPMNYNILLHPEVSRKMQNSTTQDTKISAEQLNLTDRLAGTLTDKIVKYMNREATRNGNCLSCNCKWKALSCGATCSS